MFDIHDIYTNIYVWRQNYHNDCFVQACNTFKRASSITLPQMKIGYVQEVKIYVNLSVVLHSMVVFLFSFEI